MDNYFKGYYYKHQKDGYTISFIPGVSNNKEFIQIITNENSYNIPYIGKNIFSKYGIIVNINEPDIKIEGKINYNRLHPIKYNIMGPFKYLPMECSHEIVSMKHKLDGYLTINKKTINFTNGIGYIEGDSGISFPKEYTWIQSNDLPNETSIMLSIATIPFLGTNFNGCICIVHYKGKEYRFASYLGVKILINDGKNIILKQGKYCLIVTIKNNKGYNLKAPSMGKMTKIINESLNCNDRFRLYKNKKLMFDYKSKNSSYEHVK